MLFHLEKANCKEHIDYFTRPQYDALSKRIFICYKLKDSKCCFRKSINIMELYTKRF